ncbi:uncharacterized protein MAM_05066 [Metarhizium album ARSEF 1941]|uniref:Uncharacterized protein n=1 Tax=Metarhizium album (strain ARSEF 1941) TaxID=1081103 RepID=A0A0B2WU15_METAS|nr:uncharacterized protein MAM_05066 [Metarhizium album ARSEF 1941]KHN96957.1 hypothetical protein MAM_05066 [Metarhizium album ARSEF 1941]
MPFGHRAHHQTTTTTRPGLFSRRPRQVHHQKRKPTVRDKVSGALMKLRASLTRRPGLKAAGTRRMRGTDGRGGHKHGHAF